MMAKLARNHHYIPQCYLRGFGVGAGKRCRITVADLKSERYFETNPRNICGIRDFNRVAVEGMKPDALEGMLSGFEGEVAAAIRSVTENSKFEGSDRTAILNLIALLAIRSPQQRENIRQFEEQLMKQILGLSLATKERWEGQMKQLKKAGKEIDDSLTYEDMKDFYDKDEYDISLNNEHHIGLEFTGMDAILPTLAHRKWRLFTTTPAQGCFIASDHPVLLRFRHPEKVPMMFRHSPGHGLPDTEVMFPLTHNFLLVGAFDGEEGTVPASFELVAMANQQIISRAFEQIYTTDRMFPYIGPDMQLRCDAGFMEVFRSASKLEARKPPA